MREVERVSEEKLCRIVTADEMQIGFMSEKGRIHALFILRRM